MSQFELGSVVMLHWRNRREDRDNMTHTQVTFYTYGGGVHVSYEALVDTGQEYSTIRKSAMDILDPMWRQKKWPRRLLSRDEVYHPDFDLTTVVLEVMGRRCCAQVRVMDDEGELREMEDAWDQFTSIGNAELIALELLVDPWASTVLFRPQSVGQRRWWYGGYTVEGAVIIVESNGNEVETALAYESAANSSAIQGAP